MVCIICFDVFALIAFLKHDRYSSEVTKPINNLDVTYATFHWLKLVRPCVAQKCLDSNPASLRKGLSIALEQITYWQVIARDPGFPLFTETNHPKLHRFKRKFFRKER